MPSWCARLDAVLAGPVERVIHLCLIRLSLSFHLLQLLLRTGRQLRMERCLYAHTFAIEERLQLCNLSVESIDLRAQGRQLLAIPRWIFFLRIRLRSRAHVPRRTIPNHRDAAVVVQGVDLVVGPDLGWFCIYSGRSLPLRRRWRRARGGRLLRCCHRLRLAIARL
jgi:hypothetical protein